ncbi:MAG: hypothetical protein O7E52_20285 [Candidatus Poribacteria bacterium]|nr:hypothetical protein [Candidatus Poribacteria bacterium]
MDTVIPRDNARVSEIIGVGLTTVNIPPLPQPRQGILKDLTAVLHTRLKLVPNLTEHTLSRTAIHIVLVTIVSVAFAVVGVGFRLGFFD